MSKLQGQFEEISDLLFDLRKRSGRQVDLLTEIRDLLKAQKGPSEQGQKPDYRPTPPTGPASAKPLGYAPSRPLEGYYKCPVCGSREPMGYINCEHPGCPDGRDQSVYRK